MPCVHPNLRCELHSSKTGSGFLNPDLFDHFALSGDRLLTLPFAPLPVVQHGHHDRVSGWNEGVDCVWCDGYERRQRFLEPMAQPTGYGLYRQVRAFGFECDVVAPSLVPVRAGERVKTDRLDAIRLARLLRAGELTPIWVPDETHEAMRDLVRARESAAEDQRHKRQLVSAFLLRHGRIYHRTKPWTMRYRR